MESLLIDATILLNAMAAGQALLLIFFLLRKRGSTRSTWLLVTLLASFSALILNTVIILSGNKPALPFYEEFSNGFILNVGPCIYLYLLLRVRQVKTKSIWLHFTPFLGYFLVNALFYFQIVGAEIKTIGDNLAFGIMNVQIPLYTIACYRLINRHQKLIKNKYSYVEWISLTWFKNTLTLFAVIYLFQVLFWILIANNVFLPDYITMNGTLMLSISIFVLTYQSLSHPEQPIEIRPKYETSRLDGNKSRQYLMQIRQLMENQELHLDPQLTIKDLSEHSGIQAREISQIINQELQQNFYDFVNNYRVKDFISRMKSPKSQRLSLLGVARESGFQSGSSFNAAVKKHTGKVPSYFKTG